MDRLNTPLFTFMLSSLVALALLSAPGLDAAEAQPWTLRPVYTISIGPYALDYDETRGEFQIRINDESKSPKDQEILAISKGYAVELEDGKEYTPATMELGKALREKLSTPQGEGGSYTLTLPAKDGVQITHQAITFKTWPFVMMRLSVKNVGDKPLSIKRLSPVVFGPGGLKTWTPEVTATGRHCTFRCGYPVYKRTGPASYLIFHEQARQISLAMGLAPSGAGAGSADFVAAGTEWQGAFSNTFSPARTLLPGAILQSDPVFISHGKGNPQMAEFYYAWALSVLKRPQKLDPAPRAWAAIPEEGSLKDLLHNASTLAECGVAHALLPASWEGLPGSLEGAAPRFPKKIGQAAKALREAGFSPGITLDPLKIQGGKDAWTAKSPDGQAWINPADPGGKKAIADRIQQLRTAGFDFFLIEPSTIPESVLKTFGLSLGEAEWRLFEAAVAGADTAPVLPAAEDSLPPNRDAWLQACAATCRMGRYAIPMGPVRLEAQGMKELSEELIAALRLWPAPIEILGTPASAGAAGLTKALHGDRLHAFPIDAAERVPCLWQIMEEKDENDDYLGAAVLAFQGAPAWKLDQLSLHEEISRIVWRTSDGAFVDVRNKPAPASEGLTVFGVIPEVSHPTFMGVVNDSALHLDLVKDIRWDAAEGVLNGVFSSSTCANGVAYVVAPSPWTCKSVKVGGKSFKATVTGKRIEVPLNGATNFTLTFTK